MQLSKPLKLTAYFLILILACSITATVATSTNTFTLSSGVYPSGVAYTVYKEGNVYTAKDAYGKNAFTGTDASTVVQSAINTGFKGKMFFVNGEYTFATTIVYKSGQIFCGEAMPAVNWGATPINGVAQGHAYGTSLYYSGAGDYLFTSNDNTGVTVGFENLAIFDGGINIKTIPQDCYIKDTIIVSAPNIAINIDGKEGNLVTLTNVVIEGQWTTHTGIMVLADWVELYSVVISETTTEGVHVGNNTIGAYHFSAYDLHTYRMMGYAVKLEYSFHTYILDMEDERAPTDTSLGGIYNYATNPDLDILIEGFNYQALNDNGKPYKPFVDCAADFYGPKMKVTHGGWNCQTEVAGTIAITGFSATFYTNLTLIVNGTGSPITFERGSQITITPYAVSGAYASYKIDPTSGDVITVRFFDANGDPVSVTGWFGFRAELYHPAFRLVTV